MQCCSTCKNEKTSCTNGNKEQNSPSVFFHWNTEGLREAAHWAALHAHSARRRLRTSSERLGVSAESHGPYDRKEKKKKKRKWTWIALTLCLPESRGLFQVFNSQSQIGRSCFHTRVQTHSTTCWVFHPRLFKVPLCDVDASLLAPGTKGLIC